MRWPWSRARVASSGSGPASSAPVRPAPALALPQRPYCPRPAVERPLEEALRASRNCVVFGPPRHGKTTLLARFLDEKDAVYIDCRPDLGRSQIYRLLLSSLGYSVLVSSKRKKKANATVKFNLLGNEVGGDAGGEDERTLEAVSVDLKNPTELTYLITKLGRAPWLVLNNFHLLDEGTQENLLFDLVCFAERSRLRFIVVGAWDDEEHLEEIEPALAGKLDFVPVPVWQRNELEELGRLVAPGMERPRLDELLSLSAGDVSLFLALVASLGRDGQAVDRHLVLSRFRRGFATSMRALGERREGQYGYHSLSIGPVLTRNDAFDADDEPEADARSVTDVDLRTRLPFSDGRTVRLDGSGRPEFFEELDGELETHQGSLVAFVLRQLHQAVASGMDKIELSSTIDALVASLDPKPIATEAARLKQIFANFVEAQRLACVLPPMFGLAGGGRELQIVDRRLFLWLEQVSLEDLEDFIEESAPTSAPKPRRRGFLTQRIESWQADRYVRDAVAAANQARSKLAPS